MPAQCALKDHFDAQLGSIARGKKHTSPSTHNDVAILAEHYHEAKAHEYKKGRKHRSEGDQTHDYCQVGQKVIQDRIDSWADKRTKEWSEEQDHEGFKDENN
jgi:beta-xylosidase